MTITMYSISRSRAPAKISSTTTDGQSMSNRWSKGYPAVCTCIYGDYTTLGKDNSVVQNAVAISPYNRRLAFAYFLDH